MKKSSMIITALLAGCTVAIAQEPSKGRIYIGGAQDAPAWVWQVPKPSADASQLAANAAWAKQAESACAQQRADADKAMLKAEAARAQYAAGPGSKTLKPDSGGPQFARERGIILDFNPITQSGVISGDDGRRWPLRAADWVDPGVDPQRGLWVDFVPEPETGWALFAYSLGPFSTKHLELAHTR